MTKRIKRRYRLKRKYFNILMITIFIIAVTLIYNVNLVNKLFSYTIDNYVKKDESFFNKVISVKTKKLNNNKNITNIDKEKEEPIFAVSNNNDISPIVYLYNTHETEKYANENYQGTSFSPTIVNATSYLREKLSNNGISTILENKKVSEVLKNNNWYYGKSYKVSRTFLDEAVISYPNIKYFFDIHRDAGSHDKTTICYDNKCFAKILFVIGLENENYRKNNEFAQILSNKLNEKVSGISRGIMQKTGPNVNGVYNQDFNENTLLIEIGGENNYIKEVYNSIDILSEVLIDYIKGMI